MENIAVHVPNEYLSTAVQKYLSDKGYIWGGDTYPRIKDNVSEYICWCPKEKSITHSGKEYLQYKGHKLITVTQFFELMEEEEKKIVLFADQEVWVNERNSGFYLPLFPGEVFINWETYDKIGTLRGKN